MPCGTSFERPLPPPAEGPGAPECILQDGKRGVNGEQSEANAALQRAQLGALRGKHNSAAGVILFRAHRTHSTLEPAVFILEEPYVSDLMSLIHISEPTRLGMISYA